MFANIEKQIRKRDIIIQPEQFIDIFQESARVLQLGTDWYIFYWKTMCSENIKSTSSLHFKINSYKRIVISRTASDDIVVQGEPYYKHSVNVSNRILKKGKSSININPEEVDLQTIPIKPEKLSNIDDLLHFGLEWIRFWTGVLQKKSLTGYKINTK